jgi:transcriptional regulator
MYLPEHFAENRPAVLQQLIAAQPLATLVTHGEGGLDANHIPLLLDPQAGPHGTLRGHIARANPLARHPGGEVLVIFQGPQAYISPNWYPSKAEHGQAVPTWNYAVVHARGPLRIVDDPVWLRAQLEQLTARHEAVQARPWQLSDAPEDFLARQLRAIVGIEIPIASLSGKWKTSQNRLPADRDGVVRGLQAAGGEQAMAMAALVSQPAR